MSRLRDFTETTVRNTIRELANPANEHARIQLVAFCDGVLTAAREGGAICLSEQRAATDAMAGRAVDINDGVWW